MQLFRIETKSSGGGGKLTSMDVLKGICIILVVFTHSNWTGAERLELFFPFWVEMAVPIFMFISGYLYSLSYDRHNVTSFSDAYDSSYLMKKVIRFTIPFLIIFICELFFDGTHKTLALFPNSFFRGGRGPGSYYYPIMIQLIFLFPIIYFILKKYPNSLKGLMILFFGNVIYEVLQSAYLMNTACYRLLIFRYIFIIAFGAYVFINKFQLCKRELFFIFVLGFMYIFSLRYLGFKDRIVNASWVGTSVFAVLYIVPFCYLFMLKCSRLHNTILEYIGASSFNIFLFQKFYYEYVVKYIYKYVDSFILSLLCNVTICLIVGCFFYYLEAKLTKSIMMLLKTKCLIK